MLNNNDVVITIVGYPSDVEEVYFDEDKLLNNASKGTILIDMTTSSPKLAHKIYQEGTKKGIYCLDAPVTGGDSVLNGTPQLVGEIKKFLNVYYLFRTMGLRLYNR